MKTIKRIIYVDNLSEIEYNNIGVHFTSDLGYNHKGGGSNGLTIKKQYKVTILLKKYEVNEEATVISNEGHPNEKEVVLEFNQKIKAKVNVQKTTPLGGYGRPQTSEQKINIGTRCDLWVGKL